MRKPHPALAAILAVISLASSSAGARDISALIQRAEQEDAAAQADLGVKYARGQGVTRDNDRALHWLREAARQGHAKAQNGLGVMHYEGMGVPRDARQTAQWFRKAAEQGCVKAQASLAAMYMPGTGVNSAREQDRRHAESMCAPETPIGRFAPRPA